jgi:hypothetical protein
MTVYDSRCQCRMTVSPWARSAGGGQRQRHAGRCGRPRVARRRRARGCARRRCLRAAGAAATHVGAQGPVVAGCDGWRATRGAQVKKRFQAGDGRGDVGRDWIGSEQVTASWLVKYTFTRIQAYVFQRNGGPLSLH